MSLSNLPEKHSLLLLLCQFMYLCAERTDWLEWIGSEDDLKAVSEIT
jgi:hypothetical protein